jgi:hypothetical protein
MARLARVVEVPGAVYQLVIAVPICHAAIMARRADVVIAVVGHHMMQYGIRSSPIQ